MNSMLTKKPSHNNHIILKPKEHAIESRIYRCARCGALKAILMAEPAPKCVECLESGREQAGWKPTRQEILLRTRNIRKETERRRTRSETISDKITGFCGSMTFICIHAVWFCLWLGINIFTPAFAFDPYPFGFLTLIVSLEAIVLATFILISQNRQATVSELRSELDYQVDVQAEKRTVEILSLLHDIHERLARVEAKDGAKPKERNPGKILVEIPRHK